MNYYKIMLDETTKWGMRTYWFEINQAGDAERQMIFFSNGNALSYDCTHPHDEYDRLQELVVDGDEAWWVKYAIARGEFERE